jgi:hypothetical protein
MYKKLAVFYFKIYTRTHTVICMHTEREKIRSSKDEHKEENIARPHNYGKTLTNFKNAKRPMVLSANASTTAHQNPLPSLKP